MLLPSEKLNNTESELHDHPAHISLPVIMERFGLTLARMRTDLIIPGSPERCLTRVVADDSTGTAWLIEKLAEQQAAWRNRVGKLLNNLRQQGAPHVHPYKQGDNGEFVVEHNGAFWQVSPFLNGIPLPRPDYIDDGWRGQAIGSFIAGLQQAGTYCEVPENTTPPLNNYIASLTETISQRRPNVHKRVQRILPALDTFLEALPEMPHALAHGDVHPLNIIWSEEEIAGVIDWEFAGRKPVLYDAANCMGCVGFEHPDWLVRGLIPSMVSTLRDYDVIHAGNDNWLAQTMLALRFAWLSEWLRKNDREMISMELDYMEIIADNIERLNTVWQN